MSWSLPHSENQLQWSVNDFGHYSMGNLSGDWLRNIYKLEIDHVYGQKHLLRSSTAILKMSINGVSMINGLASWLIKVLQCGNNKQTMLWQAFC
jgi:hypothetical protein